MKIMNTVTIPRKLVGKGDFVVLPREEYEELLRFGSHDSEVSLTPLQKLALRRARRNLAQGQSLTLNGLKRKLGIKSR